MRSSLMATAAVSLLLTACAGTAPNQTKMAGDVMNAGAHPITIVPMGEYRTGMLDESAAEIPAFDPVSKRIFVVNGADKVVDILDMSDPSELTKIDAIDLSTWGKGANSVAIKNGVVAVAVENTDKQAPGQAVFFDTDGGFISAVTVGALPDMIKFSPDGKYVLVANEGEPNDAFTNDPEGSVSIISMAGGAENLSDDDVRTVDFKFLNDGKLPYGMRTSNPGASSVAQDVEPEYIAVSKDSKTAYVSLQENNAIAIIDIETATIKNVAGLGFKDHSVHAFDASDKDGKINIRTWPVMGMFMPDTIDAINIDGKEWVLIANEGDSRDYDGYSEETRVGKLTLDPVAFPTASTLQKDENLGRLKTTTAQGDVDGDGDFDVIYSYGARSFSVLDADGEMVFDSGDAFEQILAANYPNVFNSSDTENYSRDNRSDDKGPEPEGIASGYVNGTPYAFIGLERQGGFMVYDLTNPTNPQFVTYHSDRRFSGNPENDTAGELAPEGLQFVDAKDSPTGNAMLVVASEVSGSTKVYDLK
ncbi:MULTISPECIES: choice-of-anchor I family protein [unclassified Thalassospira]|uniref:choice-of-anchor I family protein n=1 Tax=unclassified Thalassospira TaxID=2648997 RepID=UPI0020910820|nr:MULTISPECIES: choice-of-anchor I family protein [unclassified Thalassospira]|tara:strand:- start:2469 stop:4064 length:1596 start_codon:yes stop_codon:yes gene_type:complete